MPTRTFAIVLGTLALLFSTAVFAQDPTSIKADDPAQRPVPESPADDGFVAKARRWADEHDIENKIFPREGLYVRFGDMTTGSGFAVGPAYRRYFGVGEDMFLDVGGGISTKAYKTANVKMRWTRFWNNRVELWSDFYYRDFPEEDFFGVGADSSRATRTSYSIESTDVVGRALVHVAPWMRVGADIGFFNPDVGHGADSTLPSIEERFTDSNAPGLTDQPDFLHQTLFAEVDTRDKKTPSRGGLYRVSFGTWEDTTLEQYDHHRFDASAAHFFPVRGPRHVVGAHVGLSYVNNETGHRVPFYFLPYVGGADTLRGFREFRFRDENILFFNVEYRWRAIKYLDIAPFFDAGEVRADWEDIGPTDLKTSYGIGFRVNVEDRTIVRFDIGTGGQEGTRVFFKFGPSF
jgi:outer membrane protein assembly factor BamA